MSDFTGKLAPGETNFIASKPLTQAEADALYFPIDGDLGTAQIGVSMAQVESAIASAITGNQLISLPEADSRYLEKTADFNFAIERLEARYQEWLIQNESQIESIGAGLIDAAIAEIDNHRNENPAHAWEQISDKPDFNALYRQLGVGIDWSEITNTPELTTTWNSILEKPETFPPSAHTHSWTQITGKPDFNLLYRGINSPVSWGDIVDIPAITSDWNSITGKPSQFSPTIHAPTHAPGGTDPITPNMIGAELSGAAANAIAAHLAAADPHPQYSGGNSSGGNTYNIIRSSPAFVEEFDDFLSRREFNKLGWSASTQNGWLGAEKGNRFPGAFGVYALGIYATNQAEGDWCHLRLGNFPVIPQSAQGYNNIEMSAVVGLADYWPTGWEITSRFGLLDTVAGDGENFSIMIAAEHWGGAYNWVAIWRSQSPTQRQVIGPVVGDLATKLFSLKIKIDCLNHKIEFSVDNTSIEIFVGQSAWTFGATSPIFVISRQALGPAQGRGFWVDKFLFRKNVSDEEIPVGPDEVGWADILNKPDFDSLYRLLANPIDWGDIINVPNLATDWDSIGGKPATATRWPTWTEVTSKPTAFAPSSHASTHATGGSDPITPASIGARPAGTVPWSDLTGIPTTATRWPSFSELSGPPATATRWPTWDEVTSNPFTTAVTYGSVAVAGVTGTYAGIQFAGCADPRTTFMVRAADGLSGLWTPAGWKWYFDQNGALTAGTVPWARLTGVPVQATRWPAFSEVTSPPVTATRWPTWNEVTGKPATATATTNATTLNSFGTGWTSSNSIARVLDKLVVLSGIVSRTSGTGTIVINLPFSLRPGRYLAFTVVSNTSAGFVRLDVNESGQLIVNSPNLPATFSIYLDGVSFFIP